MVTVPLENSKGAPFCRTHSGASSRRQIVYAASGPFARYAGQGGLLSDYVTNPTVTLSNAEKSTRMLLGKKSLSRFSEPRQLTVFPFYAFFEYSKAMAIPAATRPSLFGSD